MNLLPAATAPSGVLVGGAAPLPLAVQGVPVQAGLRPEHLLVVQADEGDLRGTVSEVEYLGADALAFVALDSGQEVAARVPDRSGLGVGAPVGLRLRPDRIHLFDAAGRALRDKV